MRRSLLVVSATAIIAGACSSFGEATPATPASSPGSEAGAADGAADGPGVLPDPLDGGSAGCTPIAPSWSLDFQSSLPGEYVLPGNNNIKTSIDAGAFVADAVIADNGGQYRGRFQRGLDIPSGVDHLELSFTLVAGAAPAQSNFEVGCSLYMRPDPQNPATDRRFVVRTDSKSLSFQWTSVPVSTLTGSLGAPTKQSFKLTLQAGPEGTTFAGNLRYDGIDFPANLALGSVAKAILLECGIVFGAVQASDAGVVRGYSASVDDVSLSICARP